MKKVAIAGGVASNGTLRAAMEQACKENGYSFYRPSPIFCTDNAAMIGVAAYYEYKKRDSPWMGSECSAESETGRKIKTFGEVFMERKNTAIVLAAGQGKRMNSRVQKQFLELGGKPVLYYSLNCFQQSPLITDIILVTGAESVAFCKEEIVEKYGLTKVTKVIPGGKERYDSVYEGLLACRDTEYVLIHDEPDLLLQKKLFGEEYRELRKQVPA